MKLCFSTLACLNADCDEIIGFAKKNGIEGIEFRTTNDGAVCAGASADLSQERKKLSDAKITAVDIASCVCIKKWDDEIFALLKRDIGYAKQIGAHGIRVFLGNFIAKKDDPREPLDYNGIVKMIQCGCDFAKEENISIWIETHNEFATGKVLKTLLEDVNRDNAAIIWDIMHPLEEGEEPEETWAYIGNKIDHIHIKDGLPWEDPQMGNWKYTCLGDGVVPISKIVKLLKDNGYNGFLSLEWENAWREELRQYSDNMDWILGEFVKAMVL